MTISAILQIFMIVFMIGLAGFCFALTRRLRKLNDLETGLGGAILVAASPRGVCAIALGDDPGEG